MVDKSMENVEYRIAKSYSELIGSCRLVYDAYVHCELMSPNPARMRISPYHLLPTTDVLISLLRSDVICTLSLVSDGELGLPMESIYGAEIDQKRLMGKRLAEASALADRRRALGRSLPVVLQLMALLAQCAQRREVDEILVAVHPHHSAFYQRFLGFDVFGGQRAYRAVRDKPAVALSLNLNTLQTRNPRAHRRLFGAPFSDQVLAVQEKNETFLDECRQLLNNDPSYAKSARETHLVPSELQCA